MERTGPLDILYRLTPLQWKTLFGERNPDGNVVSEGIFPLSLREYQIIMMRFRLGYTQAVTASEVGMSEEWVSWTEKRIRDKIIDHHQKTSAR